MKANVNCLRCRFRHEDNGNCTAVGGFCTAVPAAHCPLLREYLDTGMTPEEVLPKDKADEIALKLMCLADLESLCSYTRLRELAEADKNGRVVVLPRWKNEEERLERRRLMRIMADGAIDRLMKNPLKEENGPDIAELRVVNTDRLLELAKADEDGRLFLLPMEPGRPMLCQEYFERPWVMKAEGSLPSRKREKKCWRGKRMFDINEVPYAEQPQERLLPQLRGQDGRRR